MWSVYINASGTEGIETAHYLGRMVKAVTESQNSGYPATGYQLRVGNVQQKLSTEYFPDSVGRPWPDWLSAPRLPGGKCGRLALGMEPTSGIEPLTCRLRIDRSTS